MTLAAEKLRNLGVNMHEIMSFKINLIKRFASLKRLGS
jgi:hypothetical protein